MSKVAAVRLQRAVSQTAVWCVGGGVARAFDPEMCAENRLRLMSWLVTHARSPASEKSVHLRSYASPPRAFLFVANPD
jgi:hypothetical protein